MSENNSKSNTKKIPFDITELIKLFGESSKRTRQIFVLLIVTTALLLMALLNSLTAKKNWVTAKLSLLECMNDAFVFPNDSNIHFIDSISVRTLKEFYIHNEAINKNAHIDSNTYDGMNNLPNGVYLRKPTKIWNVPVNKSVEYYEKLGRTIQYAHIKEITSKQQLADILHNIYKAKTENIDFIRVPILGLAIHINYLGLYAGIILFILYYLLGRALLSEYTNMKITLTYNVMDEANHHYHYYEMLSMQQVLFRPHNLFYYRQESTFRLFRKENEWLTFSLGFTLLLSIIAFIYFMNIWLALIFLILVVAIMYLIINLNVIRRAGWRRKEVIPTNVFSAGFYIPIAVYIIIVLHDLSTSEFGLLQSRNLTLCSLFAYFLLLFLMIYAFFDCLKRSNKLDYTWENLELEYNLEFIIESLKSHNSSSEILKFGKKILVNREKDYTEHKNIRDRVKKLWFAKIQEVHFSITNAEDDPHRKDVHKAINVLSDFINDCLNPQFNESDEIQSSIKDVKASDKELNDSWKELVEWNSVDDNTKLHRGFATTLTKMIVTAQKK